MNKHPRFRDVAHLYLGVDVIILATGDRVQLKMLGVNDPYPAYCGDQWYSWPDIKPVLVRSQNMSPNQQLVAKRLTSGDDPMCWAKLALYYGQERIDMFGLLDTGEAFEAPVLKM